MEEIVFALVVFIIIYGFYLLTIILNKRKIKKLEFSKEVTYLKSKYKLDIKKINLQKLGHVIGLTNALIISLVIFVISLVDNLILKMLLGFIILIPLILVSYHLIGAHYRRKKCIILKK